MIYRHSNDFSYVVTQIYVLVKVNLDLNENFSISSIKKYFNFGFNYFNKCYHTLIYMLDIMSAINLFDPNQ